MAPSPPPDQTINIPQLLLVLVISGFAIRYFFFSPSNPNSSNANAVGVDGPGRGSHGRQRAVSNGVRAREADVERIQQMFPQIDRRSIMWNLQRDGGNVGATTERVLSGRGLEVPPQSFQPPLPPISPPNPSSTSSSSANKSTTINTHPDLITRYNLASKLSSPSSSSSTTEAEKDSSAALASAGARQAWSTNKGERQALLQRRREEMILAARRKMEAKVAAGKSGAGSASGAGASS